MVILEFNTSKLLNQVPLVFYLRWWWNWGPNIMPTNTAPQGANKVMARSGLFITTSDDRIIANH